MTVDSFPDRTINIDGKEFLYFGGTSYLGMATQKEFQKLLANNISKWGTSYGSSRKSNVKLSIYPQFENLFSQYVGSEESAAISSGMLAGKFVIENLTKSIESFYHFQNTHPAIVANNSLPLFTNGKLNKQLQNNREEEIAICVDAILSLEVKPTSLEFLDQISGKKSITFIVDESHSLGIVGENGGGIFQNISTKNLKRKIMVSSLGKAFGLAVGIIAADKEFIESMKSDPNFISASATNPAYLATFIQAQKIYKEQRKKLKVNLDYISSNLKSNYKYTFDKNYPVIYSNEISIFTSLLQSNIVITRFKYPTYKDYLNRIVITSNHTKKDLEKLIHNLNT